MSLPRYKSVLAGLCFSLACAGTTAGTDQQFVGVVAVASNYQGTLQSFNFSGVAGRIEKALRNFARLRGYSSQSIVIHVLDGTGSKEPTDGNIKQLLKHGLRLQPEDTFVFHYLGHGATWNDDLMLLTSGAESTNDLASNISSKLLVQMLSRSQAGLRLAFLDVCQVLANAQGVSASALTKASQSALDEMVKNHSGMAIYLATGNGKPAWVENENTPNKTQIGFFTKKVIEALDHPEKMNGTGSGNTIMVEDLATFLSDEVPKAVKKVYPNDDQQPTLLNQPTRARISLFKRDSDLQNSVDKVPAQRAALAFKGNLPQGTRLTPEHFSTVQAGDTILGKDPVPAVFEKDVQGACLVRNAKIGEILRWNDLGVLGTCKS